MAAALVWTRHLGTEYGAFDIQWGHGSSPVVHGDVVILLCYQPSASYLLAVDRRTGKTRWKTDRPERAHSYSTPLVVPGAGRTEVVVNSSEGVEAFDVESGARLWHYSEANRFPIPMPVRHDDRLYLGRGYRSGPFMAIRSGGRGDIAGSHVAWHVPTGAPYVSSLVYYDGLIYMAGDSGVITCVDARNGERVWQERTGGVFTASPVAADGRIYLVCESGETIVMRAGRTPEVLARNTIAGRLLASPAISGKRLFLRTDDHVIAIGR
jgi:outer membrane protein assembly factor BamB